MVSKGFYLRLQQDAEKFVVQAGKILAEYQKKVATVIQKDIADIATNADFASEQLLIKLIQHKYPNHSIYSEEVGELQHKSQFRWIIDPLDGTKEYAKGWTEYNCLVAVEHNHVLVAGVALRAGINELYVSSLGSGAYLNQVKIHVSKTSELKLGMIGFRIPANNNSTLLKRRSLQLLNHLNEASYRIRPGWDDARQCMLVARGIIDAHLVLNNAVRWYDVAPTVLLISEAGGKVTDWNGKPIQSGDLSQGLLVSNGVLHEQLLVQIKKVFGKKEINLL